MNQFSTSVSHWQVTITYIYYLGQWFSICDSWTSIVGLTWALVRDGTSQAPLNLLESETLGMRPGSGYFNQLCSDADADMRTAGLGKWLYSYHDEVFPGSFPGHLRYPLPAPAPKTCKTQKNLSSKGSASGGSYAPQIPCSQMRETRTVT